MADKPCVGSTALFVFATSSTRTTHQAHATATAKAICATCTHRQACLQDWLDHPEWDTPAAHEVIVGGTTRAERRRMRQPTDGTDPRCGTVAGRSAHDRRGERPCQACMEAYREYQRNRYTSRMIDGKHVRVLRPVNARTGMAA